MSNGGRDIERLNVTIDLETGSFTQKIKKVNQGITELEKQFRNLSKGLGDDSLEKWGLMADKARKQSQELAKAIELQEKQQEQYNKKLQQLYKQREQLEKKNTDGTQDEALKKLNSQIDKTKAQYDKLGNAINTNQSRLKKFSNEILTATNNFTKLQQSTKPLEQQLSELTTNFELQQSALNKLQANGNFFTKLGAEIELVGNKLDKNKKSIDLYQNELKSLNTSYNEATQRQAKYKKSIEELRQAIAECNDEAKKSEMNIDLGKSFDEYNQATREVDEYSQAIKECQTNINNLETENIGLAKSLGTLKFDKIGDSLKSTGQTISNIGDSLTRNVSTPLFAASAYITKYSMDYEEGMQKISAITKLTGKELEAYGDEMIQVSNSSGVAIGEVQEAVYQAISSGQDYASAIQFVNDATKLSQAGFAELGDTVNLLTNAYNIYGDSLGSTIEVADKLIKTQDLSKTTVGELSTEMSEAMAVGGSYGVSLDNILASYSKLTMQGHSTAESTTKLSAMMSELGDTGSKVGKTFQELTGKSFKQYMEEGNSLADALSLLQEQTGLTTDELVNLFGSSEAGQAVLALLSEEGSTFNEVLKEIGGSAGATQSALDKVNSSTGKSLRDSINELKNSFIDLGIAFQPVIDKVADGISKLADYISKLDEDTLETIANIAGIAMAVGPVLKVIGGITTGIGNFVTAIGQISGAASGASGALSGLSGAMSAINPYALVILIGTLVTYLGQCEEKLNDLSQEFGYFGEVVGGVFEGLSGIVRGVLSPIWEILKGLGKALVKLFQGDFKGALNELETSGAKATIAWNKAMNDMVLDTQKSNNLLRKMGQEQANHMINTYEKAGQAMKNLTKDNLDESSKLISDSLKGLSQNEIDVMRGQSDIMGLILQGVTEGMSDQEINETIKGNLEILLDGEVDTSDVEEEFETAKENINESISDTEQTVREKASNIYNGLAEGLKKNGSGSDEAIRETFAGIADTVADATDSQLDSMRKNYGESWRQLLNGITEDMDTGEVRDKMIQNFKELHMPLEDFIQQLKEDSPEMAKEFGNMVKSIEDLRALDATFVTKWEKQGFNDDEIMKVYNLLQELPTEVYTYLENNFPEALKGAESFNDVLNNLTDEQIVKLLTETGGDMSPEEFSASIEALPEEERIKLITELVQNGKLSAEEVRDLLSELPESVRTSIITQLEENGVIEKLKEIEEAPEEKQVDVNVTKTGENPGEIKEEVETIPDEKNVNVTANTSDIDNKLHTTKSTLDTVKSPDPINMTLNNSDVITKASEANTAVNGVKQNSPTQITANNSDAVSKATESNNVISSIKDKLVNITANNSDATSKGNAVKSLLASIVDKKITITASVASALSAIGSVISKLAGLGNKSVSVTARVNYVNNPIKTPNGTMSVDSSNAFGTFGYEDSFSTLQNDFTTHASIGASRTTAPTWTTQWDVYLGESALYNIDLYTELKNRIDAVGDSLDLLSAKAEHANGQDKIKLLKQQIELYKEEQKIQNELASNLKKQQNVLRSNLQGYGFQFTTDGNLKNYEEKLMSMERTLTNYEKVYEKAQKAEQAYTGKNESKKSSLSKATENAQKKMDAYKEKLDTIKTLMDEYLDITYSGIPDAKQSWEDLTNSIKDAEEEIKQAENDMREFANEKWKLDIDLNIQGADRELTKINNEIDLLNAKMEHTNDDTLLSYENQKIALLNKQMDVYLDKQRKLEASVQSYKSKLGSYGIKFAGDEMTNYEKVMKDLLASESDMYDEVSELAEEYFELLDEEIPSTILAWQELNNEIKNTKENMKEMAEEKLDITAEIEDKIREIYEDSLDKEIDAMEKATDKRIELLEKEKDAYNAMRDEADYKDDLLEQQEKINDLQKQISLAERDTSINGQQRLRELMEELEEEQKNFQELTQDHLDETVNNIYDSEIDRIQKESDKAIEALESKWNEQAIGQAIANALSSGIFTDITGEVTSLKDKLLATTVETGECFSVLGVKIKSELCDNLQTALETMQNLADINNQLLGVDYNSSLYSPSAGSTSNSKTINITSNPVFNVSGNGSDIDYDEIQRMIDESNDNLVNKIIKY